MLPFLAEIAAGIMESWRHEGSAVCKEEESTLISANVLVMVNGDGSNSDKQRTAGGHTHSFENIEREGLIGDSGYSRRTLLCFFNSIIDLHMKVRTSLRLTEG